MTDSSNSEPDDSPVSSGSRYQFSLKTMLRYTFYAAIVCHVGKDLIHESPKNIAFLIIFMIAAAPILLLPEFIDWTLGVNRKDTSSNDDAHSR